MQKPSDVSTQQDPVELRIMQQAELLDAIVSSMAQGLLAVDARGLVIAINQQCRSMHTLPDNLCAPGIHFLELARYGAVHGFYGPGDPELLAQERWREASAGNDQYRSLSITPSGLTIEVTGRSMPGGGFVNTYTDVTESLAREAALRAAEARFRLLAEHSSDVVCLDDLDGIRRYISPAVERLLGWTPAELLGRNGIEFVHPDDRGIVREAQLRMRNGASEDGGLFRHRHKNNSWVWIESRGRMPRADEAGDTQGYIVVLRDARERVHNEQLLRYALEKVERLAITDGMTGLANRRHFDQIAQREWRRCARRKLPLSVLMIDVDCFKLFNDHYGHLAGDKCLRAIASQIATVARRPGDLAARYGGEEFVLLMPETVRDGALHVATSLCILVQELGILHAANPATGIVTVSIGVASCSPGQPGSSLLNLRGLLSAVDISLYRAKSDGRNRVAIAESPSRQA